MLLYFFVLCPSYVLLRQLPHVHLKQYFKLFKLLLELLFLESQIAYEHVRLSLPVVTFFLHSMCLYLVGKVTDDFFLITYSLLVAVDSLNHLLISLLMKVQLLTSSLYILSLCL